MIDPVIKEIWCEALESGEFEQGRGVLKMPHMKMLSDDPDKYSYCCLGVLCEKLYPGSFVKELAGYSEILQIQLEEKVVESRTELPDEVREIIGMNHCDMIHLIKLNDSEKRPFKEIATYIRENL